MHDQYFNEFSYSLYQRQYLITIITSTFYPYKLQIMNILHKEKEIDFVPLRNRLSISDGGLQSHFRYLEKDNLVTVRKEFKGRKPHTIYSITEKGIDEFIKLKERLFEVLK